MNSRNLHFLIVPVFNFRKAGSELELMLSAREVSGYALTHLAEERAPNEKLSNSRGYGRTGGLFQRGGLS
jgi:hypothetical protein